MSIPPRDVHNRLRAHLLIDGLPLVLDTRASQGSWLVDARDGTRYLDLFSFFASAALGMHHAGMTHDRQFLAELAEVALHKPSNSDIYTTQLADFVATFARVLGDPRLPHLFFIEGGGLAVENALKTAFDWKSRHNQAAGRAAGLGTRVLHLRHAFHGRTGYTLSLTNTDPIKTARFPVFDWPRISTPGMRFPVADHLDQIVAAEAEALAQAEAAFQAHPHDIACFIAEPILGEGGDIHLRAEFLQQMATLCRRYDALFVLDEVQTGCGLTGSAWAYQQLGLAPDIVAFGKKLQVCGIMAGGRVDEVSDNVFAVSGRINSTWGGNLTDMVRARRILEIIESDGLIAHVADLGRHLLGALQELAQRQPGLSNVRGRGLMCAVDLADSATRDAVQRRLRDDQHVIVLGCGPVSIRFRPALTVTTQELDHGVAALDRAVAMTA